MKGKMLQGQGAEFHYVLNINGSEHLSIACLSGPSGAKLVYSNPGTKKNKQTIPDYCIVCVPVVIFVDSNYNSAL